ncbi:MAG: ROK family protein [Actinomycetaceae bacterium]|nr:ROK family protein [Actinomycetaceae bacterium]
MFKYGIGVDVGGTTIKVALADRDGNILYHHAAPTPTSGSADVVHAVAALYRDVIFAIRDGRVGEDDPYFSVALAPGITVAIPGIVDETRGIGVYSINLGWRDCPMREMLEDALGRTVTLAHDVRSGAFAEYYWGNAERNSLYIALGTGVSAALIINGKPTAASPWAGEIGQIAVKNPDGEGMRTMEQIASAAAIARRMRATCPGSISEDADARAVFRLAEHGNAEAERIIATACHELAKVISSALHVLGPMPVIIGGGLSKAGETLLQPIRREIAELTPILPEVEVRAATLGAHSQVLGAVATTFAAIDRLTQLAFKH